MAFGHRSRWACDVLVAAAALIIALSVRRTPWPPVAEGARILAVQTVAGQSHWNFMSPLLGALVDAGHAVTAFSVNVDDDGGRENFTQVDVSGGIRKVRDVDLRRMLDTYGDPIGTAIRLVAMSRERCDRAYENDELSAALRGDGGDHYDLVITEPLFSKCVSLAADKLRVPAVYATALPTVPFAERAIAGHQSNPAYVAHVAAAGGVPRTFALRLVNAAQSALSAVLVACTEHWLKRCAPKEYDDDPSFAPSLTFVNGHFASDAAAPAAPHVIHVGGLHLRPVKTLPQDILEFVEQSPGDVICFTLGSTVKMSTIPEHIKSALIAALAQLPYRVLLKYEEEMADKPKNIMTKKWLPQRDILMHPKVKLFISHGGISGLYEAVDAGVPVLGFPLFGDQWRNVDNLVNAGMAISMDLLSVTKDEFLHNVLELLDDRNEYMENAKTSSKIFKDRPMTPAQSVVFWTEYVLRHKGAPHLKSSAPDLTWYQYYLLDVISLLLSVTFVSFLVTYRIIKTIYKHCISFSQRSKTKSK